MVEKVLQILSYVADIGCFVIVVSEKAAYLIGRLRARREARREEKGSENK